MMIGCLDSRRSGLTGFHRGPQIAAGGVIDDGREFYRSHRALRTHGPFTQRRSYSDAAPCPQPKNINRIGQAYQ